MDNKEITSSNKERGWSGSLSTFQKEFNRMFDDFFKGIEHAPSLFKKDLSLFDPSVDVSENEKEILVTAELPGVDEKDVELTISKNNLIIEGEKKKESEEKNKDYYRKEISYGSFRQVLPLPAEVDESKIEANYQKGVLKIKLPKTAKAQEETKKIPIKAEIGRASCRERV